MISLIPLYYVAIAIFTVLFANFNPYFTLPEAVNKISGYIESSTYELQHTFAKRHGFDHGWLDAPYVRSARLFARRLSQNEYISPIISYISNVYATVYLFVLPYLQGAQKLAKPYCESIKSTLAPIVTAIIDFLRPYYATIETFLTPYYLCINKFVTKSASQVGRFVRPHLETIYYQQQQALTWIASQYTVYIEPYVNVVKGYITPYIETATLWYNETLLPVLREHSDVAVVVTAAFVVLFVIPTIFSIAKWFLTAVTKDAYELGHSVNTMYTYEEEVSVISEGSSNGGTGTARTRTQRTTKTTTDSQEEEEELEASLSVYTTSDILSSVDPASRAHTSHSLAPPLTPEGEADSGFTRFNRSTRPSDQSIAAALAAAAAAAGRSSRPRS
ncbi:DEKNAAC103388 [Brettanomyces naardenensis]|uniref:DEKNAAC103388 n=1 Tax=Brettanomyces naardenensis TaxID=13370 RepID=A0A448YN63_BRENA|nr:DEKNAAC103388 [Brettanomyces naardenensis]